MKLVAALSFSAMAATAAAQSAFTTSKGGSAIFFDGSQAKTQITLNSSTSDIDALLSTSFGGYKPSHFGNRVGGSSVRPMQLTFDVGGHPNGTQSALFTNNALASNLFGKVSLVLPSFSTGNPSSPREEQPGAVKYDAASINAGIGNPTAELYTPNGSTGSFASKSMTSWNCGVDYWQARVYPQGQNLLLGASFGVDHDSNVSALTSSQIVSLQNLGSGNTIQTTKTAYLASKYKEGTSWPFRIDSVIELPMFHGTDPKTGLPSWVQMIGLAAFATKGSVGTSQWEPGIGLVLPQKNSPAVILGALTATWVNGRPTVALMAGYAF